jgi:hypothetical protein
MNCPRCQTANAADAAFCGNCGTRLAPAQAAAPSGYEESAPGTPLGYGPSAPAGQYQQPSAGYPQGQYQPPAGGYQRAQYDAPAGGYPQGQYESPSGFPQGQQYQPPAQGSYTPRPAGPSFNFNLNRLTRVDKIVAIATLVTFISLWLPWYSVSVGGLDGSESISFDATSWGHGWMWLELLVAIALLVYLVARTGWDTLPFNLPVAHAPLLIVGTGLQLLLVVLDFAIIPYGNEGMGWGWGAFIGLIAALAAAGPVIYPAVQSYNASRNSAGPRSY